MQITITFVLVDFSWIFFRADRFKDALAIVRKMITVRNPWVLFDGSIYNCGLDVKNFWLMIICIIILLFADYCKSKKIKIRDVISQQDYWFRGVVIVVSIMFILIFGIYGPSYDAANFIYFQF